jgi:general secretion pathway protein F
MSARDSTLAFEVIGVLPQGGVRTTRVLAPDSRRATEQLQLEGLRVLSCRPAPPGITDGLAAMLSRRARLDVGLFTEELAALLEAGLGMLDAIGTLAVKEQDARARAALEQVTGDLTEGLPLSRALANQSGTFPALLIAAVAASEQTGDLVVQLRRYSAHIEELASLRGKVVGAAVYPVLLLVVGSAVVLFLLGVVVPRFALLLEGAHSDLPTASRLLLGLGKAIAMHPWLYVGALGGLVALSGYGLLRAIRSGWQIRGLQSLWIVGPLVRTFRHAQFYRTSAMLVQGGIPVVRAFSMSRQLLTPEDQLGLDAANAAIAEGGRIGPALHARQIADEVALRMLDVAQRTGRLSEVLARIAQFKEAQLASAVAVTSRLIEPALMIFIGLVIGAIVVLMYLPIFDLASSLQ